ncbi:nitroreductase [Streptomyces sp. UG1]|uniref:nitroreductase family protein n=1 Tax=Streptomyces sp. UG1 TaxID=3417652 RepID=UPI003CEDB4E3
MDLVAVLARARSPEQPGPDTPAGPTVRRWPGPACPLPEARPGELDMGQLLRLSLAASDGAGRLRPAPSAGALHPVDARLVVGTGCPLPPGCYGYDPLRHRVHRLGPEPDGPPAGVTVELSVTAQRTISHYGHRAWPLILLDTGHAAGALWLAGRALGVGPVTVRLDGSDEDPLATVHFAPPEEARRAPLAEAAPEVPLPEGTRRASQPEGVLRGAPAEGVLQGAPAGRTGQGVLLGGSYAGVPAEGVLQGAPAGRTGQGARPGGPHAGVPAEGVHQVAPPDAAHPVAGAPAPRDLLARRSARPPMRGTPSRDALRAVLATANAASTGELAWCAAVGGPQPELVEAAPDGTLRRLAAGEARPTLAAWAAGQAWIADAGAVLLGHGCPAEADAPRIRRAHLRAGFAVHLAHLTAARHGLAARPVGSWQQADLGAALGAPPGRDWIVHGLALGTTHSEEETS